MTTRIAVISAGITEPSSTRLLADRLAEAVVRALPTGEAELEIIEVRDVAHDLTNNVLTGFAPPELRSRLDAIEAADALVVSTPIYSASYSGLFKMLIDVLPQDSLRGKPVLLGATGGTARHSLAIDHALRPLFAYLGALVAPVAVFAASEDWGSTEAGRLGERIERAGSAFAALVAGTSAPRPPDPFEHITPFETMLSQVSRA
jgi:FMN reductase